VLFQATGDNSSANDKLPAERNTFIFNAQNNSFSDSKTAEKQTSTRLNQIQRSSCEDPTCHNSGKCVNGTCNCYHGKLAIGEYLCSSVLSLALKLSLHNIVLVLTRQDLNSNGIAASVCKISNFVFRPPKAIF